MGSYNNLALLYECHFESKKITTPYPPANMGITEQLGPSGPTIQNICWPGVQTFTFDKQLLTVKIIFLLFSPHCNLYLNIQHSYEKYRVGHATNFLRNQDNRCDNGTTCQGVCDIPIKSDQCQNGATTKRIQRQATAVWLLNIITLSQEFSSVLRYVD